MNKEELEREIIRTKEQLTKLQEALESKEYNKWKPQNNEEYFYINAFNDVITNVFDTNNSLNKKLLSILNCFKTEAEAEQEAEKILVRRMLEDIARRLNKNKKLNWKSQCQYKYSIYFDYREDKIDTYPTTVPYKEQGTVYCLDKSFKDIAIQKIGKGRLIKYLKGE